jgi:putative chitinase
VEVSALQLQRVMIYGRAARLAELAPHLNASLAEAQVTTPLRAAMYLGQIGHESMSLLYLKEVWGPTIAQTRYERNARLGNTEPGDGARFRGRGAIQLTGRRNYAACGAALGLPLLEQPELVALPEYAFRVTAWFWVTATDPHGKHLNDFADKGDVEGATRVVNGGLNGLLERQIYYDRACEVLGALSLHLV